MTMPVVQIVQAGTTRLLAQRETAAAGCLRRAGFGWVLQGRAQSCVRHRLSPLKDGSGLPSRAARPYWRGASGMEQQHQTLGDL